MVIVGVDPGSLKTGLGFIELSQDGLRHIAHHVIHLPKHKELPDRLKCIYDELAKLINIYQPSILSLETSYYGKNAQSALKLGQVRGAIIVFAKNHNLDFVEFSPREVKKVVTGKGSATKQHVAYMIKSILSLEELPKPFDASDGLALAVCQALKSKETYLTQYENHRRTKRHKSRKSESWSRYVETNAHRIISG